MRQSPVEYPSWQQCRLAWSWANVRDDSADSIWTIVGPDQCYHLAFLDHSGSMYVTWHDNVMMIPMLACLITSKRNFFIHLRIFVLKRPLFCCTRFYRHMVSNGSSKRSMHCQQFAFGQRTTAGGVSPLICVRRCRRTITYFVHLHPISYGWLSNSPGYKRNKWFNIMV